MFFTSSHHLPSRERHTSKLVALTGKRFLRGLLSAVLCTAFLTGCLPKQDNELIVYSALDREFSQPILEDLGDELQMQVRVKYDQESNKTVGLATELIQTQQQPKADIFWNNEILHTLRLESLGLLEPISETDLSRFPAAYRSSTGQWCGFAARARVLIVNTDLLPDPATRPNSVYDLADKQWARKCTMARPVFGTSATHAAVLLSTLGDKQGMQLLEDMTSNAVLQGGNKQVAQKVAAGQFAFGLTDTDDAMIEVERGEPVAIVFPDQLENQCGALLIPNTLAILKNGPNPGRAQRMLKRLLESDIESRLAIGDSAQLPLAIDSDKTKPWRVTEKWLGWPSENSRRTRSPPKVKLKTMSVDFNAAAKNWDQHKAALSGLPKQLTTNEKVK